MTRRSGVSILVGVLLVGGVVFAVVRVLTAGGGSSDVGVFVILGAIALMFGMWAVVSLLRFRRNAVRAYVPVVTAVMCFAAFVAFGLAIGLRG